MPWRGSSIQDVKLSTSKYRAFVELHIEQGPVLERERLDIGVVEKIAAPSSFRFIIEGSGGHAGAVLMPERQDAFCGACEIGLLVEQAARETSSPDTVATTGGVQVEPNAINSIPFRVRMDIDLRDTQVETRGRALERIRTGAEAICRTRGLTLKFESINLDPPANAAPDLVESLLAHAHEAGLSARTLVSRAYHDALFMALLCPTTMIFIPCRNGYSHRPDEYSSPEQLRAGVSCLHARCRIGVCPSRASTAWFVSCFTLLMGKGYPSASEIVHALRLIQADFDNRPTHQVIGKGGRIFEFFPTSITDNIPPLQPEVSRAICLLSELHLERAHEATLGVGEEDRGAMIISDVLLNLNLPRTLARWTPTGAPGEVQIPLSNEYIQEGDTRIFLNGVRSTDRVLIVDDLISTGGTLAALIEAVRTTGAEILEILTVGEKVENQGRAFLFKKTGCHLKTMLATALEQREGRTASKVLRFHLGHLPPPLFDEVATVFPTGFCLPGSGD